MNKNVMKKLMVVVNSFLENYLDGVAFEVDCIQDKLAPVILVKICDSDVYKQLNINGKFVDEEVSTFEESAWEKFDYFKLHFVRKNIVELTDVKIGDFIIPDRINTLHPNDILVAVVSSIIEKDNQKIYGCNVLELLSYDYRNYPFKVEGAEYIGYLTKITQRITKDEVVIILAREAKRNLEEGISKLKRDHEDSLRNLSFFLKEVENKKSIYIKQEMRLEDYYCNGVHPLFQEYRISQPEYGMPKEDE